MVRELVRGDSLQSILEAGARSCEECLRALGQTAVQLTGLHRAGLLHA